MRHINNDPEAIHLRDQMPSCEAKSRSGQLSRAISEGVSLVVRQLENSDPKLVEQPQGLGTILGRERILGSKDHRNPTGGLGSHDVSHRSRQHETVAMLFEKLETSRDLRKGLAEIAPGPADRPVHRCDARSH